MKCWISDHQLLSQIDLSDQETLDFRSSKYWTKSICQIMKRWVPDHQILSQIDKTYHEILGSSHQILNQIYLSDHETLGSRSWNIDPNRHVRSWNIGLQIIKYWAKPICQIMEYCIPDHQILTQTDMSDHGMLGSRSSNIEPNRHVRSRNVGF